MMSDEESQGLLGIELHQYSSLSSVGNETVHGGGGRGLYQSDGGYFHEYSHTRSNRYRRRSNALVSRLADKFRAFGRNFSLRASPSTVALCVAFAATILGAGFSFDDNSTFWATVEYCGLFGVIGGLLSGLSVRLLFARSCGAVPRHGDDIKARLKSTIFDRIFKRECIALYLRKALHESLETLNIDERIEWIIDSPAVNKVLDEKLNELLASKHGVYLHLAGFSLREFKPAIKPYLINFSSELTPAIMARMHSIGDSEVKLLHDILDGILESEMINISEDDVVELVDLMTKRPFEWLVACCTTFGLLLGLMLNNIKREFNTQSLNLS